MDEQQWVGSIVQLVSHCLREREPNLAISQGTKLPYAHEIITYSGSTPSRYNTVPYETDLLVFEELGAGAWKPRVVIEGQLARITTHAAITYSEKALTHKSVHPYLRYGILLGDRKNRSLPGRLFRHGAYFDFMLSWESTQPSAIEFDDFLSIIIDEVEASRSLEEILYNSRNPKRIKYTVLHRPLRLK